jgi:cation transporter-like permease
VSNLVAEILLRLIKPIIAIVLGVIVYFVATALGEPGSVSLALLSFLAGSAFILLVQEGPI